MAANLKKPVKLSNRVSLNSLVYTADAANYKDTQKKAIDLYRQGKLFNIVLRGVGSIGDFEISKNRIYSNDAIAEAFTNYNNLVNEFPYYRMMFDSHPTSEDSDDAKQDMGESNSYDNIGAYILKLKLSNQSINGHNHNVISFDYVLTKQSILDYFMRSIDPIIAISHRGFMGNMSEIPRDVIKENYKNVTFLNEAFNNLDFQNGNADTIAYVQFLRLLGFDLVTYPADFFCVSRKQDIVGFNVTDYDTVKDTNNISHNTIFQYVKDKCANIQSPYGMLRMKVDDKYLMNSIKSKAVLDEVKFILKNGDNKMNISIDKLSDKEYMFGVFEDLNGMFTEVSDLQTMDADKISDWIDGALKQDIKEKLENRDELASSIKVLMDNHDKFADIFTEQNVLKVTDHNSNIVKTMIDALGMDTFTQIMDKDFNLANEDVIKILDGVKQENPELFESVTNNFITMVDDNEYFKEIASGVIASINESAKSAVTTDSTEPTMTDSSINTDVVTDSTDSEIVEDGLTFSKEASTSSQDGGAVKSTCSDIMNKEILGEDDFKKLIDEVFAIHRCYDKQSCWKLPTSDVSVSGKSVKVTLNAAGLRAASEALLGARTKIVASSDEKKAAAAHLKQKFDEVGIDPPEGLSQIADNAKFADLVTDSDFVLSITDTFAQKVIDEAEKVDSQSVNPEDEVINVLDSIYTIMRPFVADGAKIEVTEELYKKLAQSINNAAIGLAAVMNGEGSDIMNLEDNVIISTMRTQIAELKDELTGVKDNVTTLKKERDVLLEKVTDYETKVSTIGQLSEDVNKATEVVEKMNTLNNAKMRFIFDNRATVDDDIYKEVIGAKSVDQLQTIGKWVSKMVTKKLTVTNKFGDKIITESTPVATDSQILTPPVVDNNSKKNEHLDTDEQLNMIMMMIKG